MWPDAILYKHTEVSSAPSLRSFPKGNAVGFYRILPPGEKKAPGTCPFNSRSVALDTKNSTFYRLCKSSELSPTQALSARTSTKWMSKPWNQLFPRNVYRFVSFQHWVFCCSPEIVWSCSGHSQPGLSEYLNPAHIKSLYPKMIMVDITGEDLQIAPPKKKVKWKTERGTMMPAFQSREIFLSVNAYVKSYFFPQNISALML